MMRLLLIMVLALGACTPFPDLSEQESAEVANAAYPTLLPLDDLLNAPAPTATPELRVGIESRVDRLRARAGRLTGQVVDAGTQARMRRGVSHPF